MDEASRRSQLLGAIQRRLILGERVLVLSHFSDEFLQIQDAIAAAQLPYQICKSPRKAWDLFQGWQTRNNTLQLAFAESIRFPAHEMVGLDNTEVPFAVFVTERHPIPANDQALEQTLRQFPQRVRLGYFLSLEQHAVRVAINDAVVELMRHHGIQREGIVSSKFVTRRVDQVLNRIARKIEKPQDAHSAEEWFLKNCEAHSYLLSSWPVPPRQTSQLSSTELD